MSGLEKRRKNAETKRVVGSESECQDRKIYICVPGVQIDGGGRGCPTRIHCTAVQAKRHGQVEDVVARETQCYLV